jgi:hypothetical protein
LRTARNHCLLHKWMEWMNVCNNVVSSPSLCIIKWWSDQRVGSYIEGFGHGWIQSTISASAWKNWVEPWNISVITDNHLTVKFKNLWWCGLESVTLWHSWLRHHTKSQKVMGLIPDRVTEIFHWHKTSGRTMALGLTRPQTEMSIRNISWGSKGGQCIGLTTLSPSCANCLEIWVPQPPGTLRACTGIAVYLFVEWKELAQVWFKGDLHYLVCNIEH